MVKSVNKIVRDSGSNPVRVHKFRLQSKSLFLTYPKCNLDKKLAMALIKAKRPCQYIGVGHELHQDGSDHLHALVQYAEKFSTTDERFFDLRSESQTFHGKYEGAKNNDDVMTYVKKGGDFIEEGLFQSNGKSETVKRANKNKMMLEMPSNQMVNEGIIALSQLPLIEKAKDLYNKLEASQHTNDASNKVCYWVYGTPGVGKSVMAYDIMYPGENRFDKLVNKWWDSYNNQDIVVMDDVTPDHKGSLTYFLRRWADKRPFPGECKGGHTQQISFSRLIVTSNYLPEQIFEGDESTVAAIERRFNIVTIFKKSENERKLVDYPYFLQDYIEIKPIKPERIIRPKIEIVNEKMAEAYQKYGTVDLFIKDNPNNINI